MTPHEAARLAAEAMHDKIGKLVVGAFVVKDNKFLILQRAASEDFFPGFHELPSGGVEPGESLLEALHRELLEETGLTLLSIERYANRFDYASRTGVMARQLNFFVSLPDAPIRLNPIEHDAYFWASPTEADFAQFRFSIETRDVILDAYRKLNPAF